MSALIVHLELLLLLLLLHRSRMGSRPAAGIARMDVVLLFSFVFVRSRTLLLFMVIMYSTDVTLM